MYNILKTSSNEHELLKSNGPFRIISSDDSFYGSQYSDEVGINSPVVIMEEELENEKVIYKSIEVDSNEVN